MAFMKAMADEPVMLFAADMDASVAGLRMVPPQQRIQLPPGSHSDYISNLVQVCRRLRIRVVVPMSDAELLPIASARRDLGRAGTKALIPSDRTLEFAADRLAMLQACEGLVPVPRYAVFDHVLEPATWEYPVVLRSRFGEGCRVVRSAAELDSQERSLNLLVQEYLPGDEYSVDVFADSTDRSSPSSHACD